jgi:hypothetical protein
VTSPQTRGAFRILFLVTALAAITHTIGAQDPAHAPDAKKHPITITGCVRAGTEAGSYMLMDVQEISGANRPQGVPVDINGRDVLYILNSTKGLTNEVGRRVEVTGTVDLTDADKAQMKVTDDPAKLLDKTTEIKGDQQTVTVETNTDAGTGQNAAATKHTDKEPNRVLYRLDVKSIRRVPSRLCDRVVTFRPAP